MSYPTWPDLTFYPQLAGAATWSCVEGTREEPISPDTWVWAPGLQLYIDATLDDLNRIIEAGWQYLAETEDVGKQKALLPLWGQLGHTRQVHIAGSSSRQLWAPAADLERVARVPVVLAFTVPDELAAQAGRSPTGSLILSILDVLPPPQFGTVAMVSAEMEGVKGYRRYTIDQLGEDAQGLQQQLADALRTLAGGDLGWIPVTGHYDTIARGNYGRAKAHLQQLILNNRDKAIREHLHGEIARLDAALTRYRAIQVARNWVSREKWLELWEEVRQMAQQLAAEYWAHHLARIVLAAEAAEAKAKGMQIARRLPTIPNVFGADEHAAIPSALPVLDVLTSYSHGQHGTGWASDDVGYPTYIHATGQHNTAIQVRPETPTAVLDDTTIQSLWQQVKAFTDLDGDVFLAMIAQAMMVPPDDEGYVWITGGAILEYRGIKPITKREGANVARRAGHRQEDLLGIAQCIGRQASQWVIIRSTVRGDESAGSGKSGRRGKTRKFTHESRLTQVAEVIRQHELNPEDDAAEAQQASSFPVAWRYRMGTWLTPFLAGANRQVAWLCQRALRYDPYHEQWEKRLARYYMIHLRINAAGGATITRTVGKLLAELGLPVDERHPERTKARWERAHNRLAADGVIDAWGYATENPPLPARHWLETFLEWRVQISAASMPAEKYAQIAEHAQAHRERAKHLAEGHKAEGATPDE